MAKAERNPDDVDKTATKNRLIYFQARELDLYASDDAVCGQYSLFAANLTIEDITRLEFILTLPFHLNYWPYSIDDNLTLQKFADLYAKIFNSPD